jgi:hypothetical protein
MLESDASIEEKIDQLFDPKYKHFSKKLGKYPGGRDLTLLDFLIQHNTPTSQAIIEEYLKRELPVPFKDSPVFYAVKNDKYHAVEAFLNQGWHHNGHQYYCQHASVSATAEVPLLQYIAFNAECSINVFSLAAKAVVFEHGYAIGSQYLRQNFIDAEPLQVYLGGSFCLQEVNPDKVIENIKRFMPLGPPITTPQPIYRTGGLVHSATYYLALSFKEENDFYRAKDVFPGHFLATDVENFLGLYNHLIKDGGDLDKLTSHVELHSVKRALVSYIPKYFKKKDIYDVICLYFDPPFQAVIGDLLDHYFTDSDVLEDEKYALIRRLLREKGTKLDRKNLECLLKYWQLPILSQIEIAIQENHFVAFSLLLNFHSSQLVNDETFFSSLVTAVIQSEHQ